MHIDKKQHLENKSKENTRYFMWLELVPTDKFQKAYASEQDD